MAAGGLVRSVAGWLLAPLGGLAAQAEAVVLAPAWWAEPVAAAFAAALGERPAVAAVDLAAPLPPGLLLADEWTLQRLQAEGRLAAAPPGLPQPLLAFAVPVALGARTGTPLAAGGASFAAVVLQREAHDRLGCVLPQHDGSVWLALADEAQRRGEGEAAVFAYWTTLDARCGQLAGSYAELAARLAAGELHAVLGPEPWLRQLPAEQRRDLVVTLPGPAARWGFGLVPGAGAAERALFARLAAGDPLRALASALEVRPVPSAAPWSLPPATAARWAARFAAEVRGRGRGTEQLADAVDFWFGLLSLAALGVLLWRFRARQGELP